jgi:pyruvate dehydrogenase E2 component (dihydrolipoamide acetyltransferase)
MAFEVKLPDLGDGIESGDVLEIYVSEGDSVTKDQGLLELETDKATVTVPSPKAGKISKILVKTGQAVPVGSVIVQLETDDSASKQSKSAPPSTDAAKKTDNTASDSTASDSTASDSTASGEPQAKEQSSADQRSDKKRDSQSEQQPASAASSQAAAEQDTAKSVKQPSEKSSSQAASSSSSQPVSRENKSVGEASTERESEYEPGDALVAASPSVRRFAREVGVDLSGVQGTGEAGRITRDDVLKAVRESSARAASAQAASQTTKSNSGSSSGSQLASSSTAASATSGTKVQNLPGSPGQDDFGPIRVDRLPKIRKTIAIQMHKSWTVAPQVTNFDDADVTELEAFRISSKDDYAVRGIKLTSMPFLIKAVATALRNHPTINATVDLENDQIIYRDYVNLGVAVDTDRGLVVPNIRNAHLMGIPDIAKALADMAGRVRDGNFSVGELRGGTFTISNLGAVGGTYSTPILNVPEVAILLVGRTRKLPVVMSDDSIRVRQMMPLSLTYDHRLVDGAAAARFLNEVISLLETPSRLLLAIS